MSNGSCVDLLKGTLVRPIARYPASIAGDQALKVATNQVETTLNMRAGSADTIFRVSDTSRLVAQMLLSIDNEIVSVSAIDPVTNNITVVRGFDGTIPAPHNAGRMLRAYITAWHHNTLAAEITAIETALGPNLSNITGSIGIVSDNYRWQQAPGGNLTIGLNVVTLTPVPKGVNGTNIWHYLYVSGGTGAAEACLISGGTAIAGAPSGTVFITCASAHSGAWTIGTSSDGIQEAIWSTPVAGAYVQVPPGSHPIYKGFSIVRNSVTVQGQGIGATILDLSRMGSGYAVQLLNGSSNWLRDFVIAGPGSAMTPTDFAVIFDNQNSSGMDRVNVNNVPNGVRITNNPGNFRTWIQYADISYLTGTGGVCISVEGGADTFLTHIATSDPGNDDLAAIRIRKSGGAVIKNIDCLQAGLLIDPNVLGGDVGWLFLSEAMFDSTQNEPLKIAPTNGALVMGVVATNCWFATSSTKDGIRLEATLPSKVEDVSFTAIRSINNAQNGVSLVGNGVSDIIIASSIISSNDRTNAGYHGVYVDEATKLVITANTIGALPGFPANQDSGIFFAPGASNNIVITGNIIDNFVTTPITGMDQITGFERIIANNVPTTNLVVTVPSASLLNLGSVPNEQYSVTGTTPLQSLTPNWYGRKVSLVFVNGGSTIAGGNIKSAKTVPVNGSLLCTYDFAGWNVVGP